MKPKPARGAVTDWMLAHRLHRAHVANPELTAEALARRFGIPHSSTVRELLSIEEKRLKKLSRREGPR